MFSANTFSFRFSVHFKHFFLSTNDYILQAFKIANRSLTVEALGNVMHRKPKMKRRETRSLQAPLLLTIKLRGPEVFILWPINILGLQKVVGKYYAVVSRPEFAIDRTIWKDLQMKKIHSHVKCSSFPTGYFRSVPVLSVHFLFPPGF